MPGPVISRSNLRDGVAIGLVVIGRDHEMEGAANDLLLEIFIEGRPLIEDRQAIDGDAAGHHLVAGNGDEVTAIIAPVGGEVDDPPLGPVGGCHQHRGGKSERVADGGAALRQTAPEIADPLGKVLQASAGSSTVQGKARSWFLSSDHCISVTAMRPVEPFMAAWMSLRRKHRQGP